MQHIQGAINRVPALEKTGIKSTVCGPGELQLLSKLTVHHFQTKVYLCVPTIRISDNVLKLFVPPPLFGSSSNPHFCRQDLWQRGRASFPILDLGPQAQQGAQGQRGDCLNSFGHMHSQAGCRGGGCAVKRAAWGGLIRWAV